MIVLRCSILAVIIFIPLTSIQHFIPPLSQCLLADLCNHTWIPECGEENTTHDLRLFIDECDIFEYNCDNDVLYLITNYSECFVSTCPTLPEWGYTIKQGHHVFRADRRRMPYIPTTPSKTRKTVRNAHPGKRRYTPEVARRKWRMKYRTSTKCYIPKKSVTPKLRTVRTLKRTAPKLRPLRLRPISSIPTRFTTQIIRTATIATMVIRKVTFFRNGKIIYRVFKGLATTTARDPDFLE